MSVAALVSQLWLSTGCERRESASDSPSPDAPSGGGGGEGSAEPSSNDADGIDGGGSDAEAFAGSSSRRGNEGAAAQDDSGTPADAGGEDRPGLPPGAPPAIGASPYAGVRPRAGTPAAIGNTRIFDDIAGLIWNPAKQELLFVVSQNNKIMRYRPGLADAQNFDVVRPGGEHMDEMKGLDLGPDGALWVCEAQSSLPPRVSRSEASYDKPVTVVDHWQPTPAGEAARFTSPWYVSVRWDNNVYFTDTPHRYSGTANKHLFRIDPAGKLSLLKRYASDADLSEGGAYGIALSPNQRSIYISTWNHPGYPQLVRFDLAADGSVAKETLVMTDEQGPIQSVDGLCIDQAENFYLCTGGGGVRMYDPVGSFLGTLDVPGATDCSFGGADMKTLFVATSGGVAGDKNLYQVPMNIPGLP